MMNNNNSNFAPNSQPSQFEIGDNDHSFAPVDAGFVGSGAMDPPPTSFQQSTNGSVNANGTGGANSDPKPWYMRFFTCFDIDALQEYFNVDTKDVQERMKSSVVHANIPDHFREQILTKDGRKPDLYGPVWVCMTLVFFLAVTSNTAKYLHTESLNDFEYDISHLTHAMVVISFYTFVLPTLIYIMFKCINAQVSLVELISIYGYSLVPYLPTTVLCLVPSVILEWIFLLAATGVSLLLVLRNLVGLVARTSPQYAGPVTMFLAGSHLIFVLVLKFTFYRHRYHGGSSNDAAYVDGDDGVGGDDGAGGEN